MIDWKNQFHQGKIKKGAYYCLLKGKEQVMLFDGIEAFYGEDKRVLFYPKGFEILGKVPTYKECVRKWGVK